MLSFLPLCPCPKMLKHYQRGFSSETKDVGLNLLRKRIYFVASLFSGKYCNDMAVCWERHKSVIIQ